MRFPAPPFFGGVRWQRQPNPRFYYGWTMLFTVSFTEMVSWGVLYYAFTVFVKPMRQSLGWSTAQLSGAFSLALLCSALAALPIGRWIDNRGPRLLMTAGSCAASLLIVAWAHVTTLAQFYLIWAAIGVTMAAVLYDPAFALVAVWFRRLRARALTVLTFIAGFASVVFVPLAEQLVERQGWRAALLTLALLVAATTIPLHALVLRRRPADIGLPPDGLAAPLHSAHPMRSIDPAVPTAVALRSGAFRWIAVAFALSMLSSGAITVHLVPYLIDRAYSPAFAANMVGLIGLMALPGRLVFTLLGEKVSRRAVTTLLFLLQGSALPLLLLLPGIAGVIAFVVLYGAGFGAITPARAALVADLFGFAHYARISSILGLFATGARALAPLAAGVLYDLLGAYPPVLWLLAALSLLAAGAILLVRDV